MSDFGGVYLVTLFKILPPSAFFWAKNSKLDGQTDRQTHRHTDRHTWTILMTRLKSTWINYSHSICRSKMNNRKQ